MRPILQDRWRIQGNTLTYYGIRQKPYTLRNKIRLSPKIIAIIKKMDGTRQYEAYPTLSALDKLVEQGILVDITRYHRPPETLDDALYCNRCAANDYVIPGLELDEEGLCPLCTNRTAFTIYKSVLPLAGDIPKNPVGGYDAAVFYSGGKDSSYLLYYLAVVKKLRLAVLTWDMPYFSGNARQSMKNAKKALPGTEFFTLSVEPKQLSAIYGRLYALQGNTCACPSLAYLLFYPLMVEKRIPYLLLGNEPVQMRSLIYNRMAPKWLFRLSSSWISQLFINIGRLLTLSRPLRKGQFQLLMTVRQLAFGSHPLKRLAGYRNPLIEDVSAAIQEAPDFVKPIQEVIRKTSRNGDIPALVHMDFDRITPGGVYDWEAVKPLLKEHLGWVDTPESHRNLHTSCRVEACKAHTQYLRFRNMETTMIPFSALELCLASSEGGISREKALQEMRDCGFSLAEPPEMDIMRRELPKDRSLAPSVS